MSLNFEKFVISNALAKIKASTHFGSIHLLCISCCRYNNQKSQEFLLRAKSCDSQIFLIAHYMVYSYDNLVLHAHTAIFSCLMCVINTFSQ